MPRILDYQQQENKEQQTATERFQEFATIVGMAGLAIMTISGTIIVVAFLIASLTHP